MTRRAVFITVAATALLSSRAYADEHFMRIHELFLAGDNGDDAAQFVELIDPPAEPFPEEYQLGIYDPAGKSLGKVPIDPPPGTVSYLVATDAAESMFDVTADARLTRTLPPEGQVCFETLEGGETIIISCLAYGCVTNTVDAVYANFESMAPLDGQSVQRQGTGSTFGTFEMGRPTPGVANVSGTAGEAGCPPEEEPPPEEPPPEEEPPIIDDDDDGCQVAGTGESAAGLVVLALGLIFVRRRRRSGAAR